MSVQVRFLVESLIAALIRANERLLTSVDTHMSLQVEIEREALATEVAPVGFLACMDQHMPFELCIIEESLSTAVIRALEQFVAVDRVVLLQ
jgi:hypothetical protein